MKVVGIDPGTRQTGFAWRTPSGAWRCGWVRPDSLQTILLEARRDGCDVAAVEDSFLGVNPRTYRVLITLQVRILSMCGDLNLRTVTVPPLTWKSAMLTGAGYLPAGRDHQKSTALAVARRLGADPKTFDEGDAVCLAEFVQNAPEQLAFDLPKPRRRRAR